jgi:hypothetical protein
MTVRTADLETFEAAYISETSKKRERMKRKAESPDEKLTDHRPE